MDISIEVVAFIIHVPLNSLFILVFFFVCFFPQNLLLLTIWNFKNLPLKRSLADSNLFSGAFDPLFSPLPAEDYVSRFPKPLFKLIKQNHSLKLDRLDAEISVLWLLLKVCIHVLN